MDRKTVRMPIAVNRDGKPAALIVANAPHIRIRHTVKNGQIRFHISIRTVGYIDEMLQDVTQSYLQEQVQNTIEQEVRNTFNNGKIINTDVLKLATPIYRYRYATWRKYVTESMNMDKLEIDGVQAEFTIIQSGKYKGGHGRG